MSTLSQKLLEAADMASSAQAGIELIEKLTGSAKAHQAGEVLSVIAAVAAAVRSGFAGTVHPADVLAEITKLRDGLSANDAATQSEIDKKFPNG